MHTRTRARFIIFIDKNYKDAHTRARLARPSVALCGGGPLIEGPYGATGSLAHAHVLIDFYADKLNYYLMIDDFTIQRIKDAAHIRDVVGDFYELRRRGVEYECLCPFHEDRHLGSFKISPRKNYAKCFACGWQGGSVDFLMEHEHLSFLDAIRWLGKKYSIDCEGVDKFTVKPSAKREVPQLPMLVLPEWMVQMRQTSCENKLVRWLAGRNWDSSQRERLYQALEDYRIGESRYGHTIFWQIDEKQQVRTGKMMLYKDDGHRNKEVKHNFDWVHSALYRDYRSGYSADKTDMKQCLFGMHLLDKYRVPNVDQEVCIVESEKTALIMAIAYGNNAKQVWMACGGAENLSREKLKPIIEQGRAIHLYPDRDAIETWQRKAEQLRYKRLKVDTTLVTKYWKPEDGEKADIADVVVRLTDSNPRHMVAGDAMTKLKKRLDLIEVI